MSTNPLQKLLGKLGLTYETMNEEERRTFNAWREALAGRRLTDDDVKHFLDVEYHDAVKKLTSKQLSEREDIFLKMKVDFIINIKEFLSLPAAEKAMVEQQIESQL